MVGKSFPVERVELVSVLLEEVLYGFSLLMFGGTIWALLSQRSSHRVSFKILAVACLLLLVSTAHSVVNIIRLMEGFVSSRETFPGGSAAFFEDASQWTFVCRHYIFTIQTLLGDCVVLYRCYVAWQSKLVMILPVFLWCSAGVTGIGGPYLAAHVGRDVVFGSSETVVRWITLFWASALATNVLTTLLLTYRIWHVDRTAMQTYGLSKSQLKQFLHIIIDAGLVYSLVLLIAFISFLFQANFQYGMITPIVSITFYMVIVRVSLAKRAQRPLSVQLQHVSRSSSDPGLEMEVRIMTLTERAFDNRDGSTKRVIDLERNQHGDKPAFLGDVCPMTGLPLKR